jgi:hypothetical protein
MHRQLVRHPLAFGNKQCLESRPIGCPMSRASVFWPFWQSLALLAKSGPLGKVWPFGQSLALCQPVVPCHGLMAGREKVSVRGCRSYSPSDRMS